MESEPKKSILKSNKNMYNNQFIIMLWGGGGGGEDIVFGVEASQSNVGTRQEI